MNAAKELKKILKATGKPKRQIYNEMKISPGTFYNILLKRTTPNSRLFFDKVEEMKTKYGVK